MDADVDDNARLTFRLLDRRNSPLISPGVATVTRAAEGSWGEVADGRGVFDVDPVRGTVTTRSSLIGYQMKVFQIAITVHDNGQCLLLVLVLVLSRLNVS